MKSNKKDVILEFSLPEFAKKDIKVKVTKDSVVVKAEKKSQKKVKKKDFFHAESSHRVFNYATTIPAVDSKKTKITFSKGILKIKAPRK